MSITINSVKVIDTPLSCLPIDFESMSLETMEELYNTLQSTYDETRDSMHKKFVVDQETPQLNGTTTDPDRDSPCLKRRSSLG